MMNEYWESCIQEALEDAKLKASEEQINTLVSWVEGAHENFSMFYGYDIADKNLICEKEDARKKELENLNRQHEAELAEIEREHKNRMLNNRIHIDNLREKIKELENQ